MRLAGRARVLAGACDDLVTPRTLGPFRDMARGAAPALAVAVEPGAARDAVFGAVHQELGGRPAVLLVEDVHWADDATLDVLRYLAWRVPELPCVLVLTTARTSCAASTPCAGSWPPSPTRLLRYLARCGHPVGRPGRLPARVRPRHRRRLGRGGRAVAVPRRSLRARPGAGRLGPPAGAAGGAGRPRPARRRGRGHSGPSGPAPDGGQPPPSPPPPPHPGQPAGLTDRQLEVLALSPRA